MYYGPRHIRMKGKYGSIDALWLSVILRLAVDYENGKASEKEVLDAMNNGPINYYISCRLNIDKPVFTIDECRKVFDNIKAFLRSKDDADEVEKQRRSKINYATELCMAYARFLRGSPLSAGRRQVVWAFGPLFEHYGYAYKNGRKYFPRKVFPHPRGAHICTVCTVINLAERKATLEQMRTYSRNGNAAIDIIYRTLKDIGVISTHLVDRKHYIDICSREEELCRIRWIFEHAYKNYA